MTVEEILIQETFDRDDLIRLLSADEPERRLIYKKSSDIKEKYVGKKVYFRGLIEYSNICRKDCYYCGVRSGNTSVKRYQLTDDEVVEAARFALENHLHRWLSNRVSGTIKNLWKPSAIYLQRSKIFPAENWA